MKMTSPLIRKSNYCSALDSLLVRILNTSISALAARDCCIVPVGVMKLGETLRGNNSRDEKSR
jgi:hypothetical protein